MGSRKGAHSEGPMEQLGEQVGGIVGKVAGRLNDKAMDVASQVLGAGIQQMSDWWESASAKEASSSFREKEDRNCMSHHEERKQRKEREEREEREERKQKRASHSESYDSVRPLYQFGFTAAQNPEYGEKTFAEVEDDIRRAWSEDSRHRFGEWGEARDRIEYGYSTRRSGRDEIRAAPDTRLKPSPGPEKAHGDGLLQGNGSRHGSL